jgi:hypothetical protein
MTPAPSLRLSCLLRELDDAGFQAETLTYRKLWEGAVEGRYPAHQVTGRWHFRAADVPAIAAVYHLRRKSRAVPHSRASVPATAA